MTFNEIFESGLATLARVWRNQNSEKNQVNVMFCQKVENDSAPVNRMLSVSQGGTPYQTAVAVTSFKEEVITSLIGQELPEDGVIEFRENNAESFSANDLFGFEVNVEVLENHTAEEVNADGEVVRTVDQKINPRTKAPITNGGKPVYRHTSLVDRPATHVFLPTDTAVAEKVVVEKEATMDAGAN